MTLIEAKERAMDKEPCQSQTRAISPAQHQELVALGIGTVHRDVSMANYTTFKAGGPAEALVDVHNLVGLTELVKWLQAQALNWQVIGRGSNILVSSRGFAGVIIRLLGEFRQITPPTASGKSENNRVVVRVGSGCSLARLISWGLANNLGGLEFLTGIPGNIGGAIRMNAGAWGSTIAERLLTVTYLDGAGALHEVEHDDHVFTYRRTQVDRAWAKHSVIVAATVGLEPRPKKELQEYCRQIMEKRRAKQPANLPSAGSFFKNPPGDFAGRLIEAAGLKGLTRGQAMVSPKHANFIVNTGQASAADILTLMREVQKRVYDHCGIYLEPEVHLW